MSINYHLFCVEYNYSFIHRQDIFIHKQKLCLFCNIKQAKTIRSTRRKERNQWHSNFKQKVRVSSSWSALHHWHQDTLYSLWLYIKQTITCNFIVQLEWLQGRMNVIITLPNNTIYFSMKQVCVLSAEILLKMALNTITLTLCVIGNGCLMLFPTICQFYRGRQFYWDCNRGILKKRNFVQNLCHIKTFINQTIIRGKDKWRV